MMKEAIEAGMKANSLSSNFGPPSIISEGQLTDKTKPSVHKDNAEFSTETNDLPMEGESGLGDEEISTS
jgi:hypothetical protein